jgi:hypothetical protein
MYIRTFHELFFRVTQNGILVLDHLFPILIRKWTLNRITSLDYEPDYEQVASCKSALPYHYLAHVAIQLRPNFGSF